MKDSDLRLPLVDRLPDGFRNHFIACCGEFVGTVLFLYFALSGTQVANSVNSSAGLSVAETGSNPQQLQYIALCFGFSLAVNAWVFFRISGGLFNPAVTLGMCIIGALPWFRGFLLFITQILGGIVAAALVSCMFPGKLNVRTTLGGNTTIVQGLFIEMFLTAQLVFTIFMLAAEKHKGTFIAPVGMSLFFILLFLVHTCLPTRCAGIGLSLFIAELTGVFFTGGSLNPARSFGPALVDLEFTGYHWIYWVGPILGSLVAAGFYKFIKVLEYETANPGQDLDHAANVQKRADLLVAAGLPHHEANVVAKDLAMTPAAAGGPDGNVVANGQGRTSMEQDSSGMYGSNFRSGAHRGSDSYSDETFVQSAIPMQPLQRPQAVTTGSSLGRLDYLRDAARNSSYRPASEPRLDSPTMATHDEIYAPLTSGPNEALGGLVHPENEPRSRFSRTPSSFA